MYRILIAVLTATLLHGCSSMVTLQPSSPASATANSQHIWQQRYTQLKTLDSWKFKGRLAIVNGVEAWHMDIRWQQYQEHFLIELSGPLGMGTIQLRSYASGIELIDDEQQVFRAADAESLLLQRLGMHMPVNNLKYWVLGYPSLKEAAPEDMQLDDAGRLKHLQQENWQVNFKGYQLVRAHDLPNKVFANYGDELKIKLVVDEWQLNGG